MDALQRVWQQREAAHRAASEAEQAKAKDALAADCRLAREVGYISIVICSSRLASSASAVLGLDLAVVPLNLLSAARPPSPIPAGRASAFLLQLGLLTGSVRAPAVAILTLTNTTQNQHRYVLYL